MAVLVLAHPAWFGGWCWQELVPLLAEHGHSVHTPTLTGLGERSHLAHPGIVLQTHIDDVTSMLTYADLREVILAGTSSSGAVISGVADRGWPHPGFDRYAQAAGQDPRWRLVQLQSNHLPYITSPHELAPALLELAAS